MKPDTTASTLNHWRDIRNWAMATVLLLLLTVAGTARGQSITNLIYQDSFERSGLLSGSTPDTDATGAQYIAGPTVFTGNWTDQQGGTENACYLSNSLPTALSGPLYVEAFLPALIETGHVYSLTASILVSTNYNEFWGALGYCSTPSLAAFQGQWTAGTLLRSTNDPGTGNGNLQAFNGSGTGGGTTINFSPNSVIQPQFITITEILNLSNPAAILEVWETNGVPFKTNNCGTTLSGVGANNGMWPHFITFGASNCGGWVTNFSLVDVIPSPTGPTILEQPNNLTAPQGQTATFWVNAIGTPDPTYQWMSNNVAIAGATNATYTTPPLSSSYNGASYSVQVVNVAGSVPSSSVTLTVTAGHPTVYSATKTANPNNIVVNFSGAVDATTSQNANNYTLNNSASVTSVSPGSTPSSVILTTSTLNPALPYNLIVNHVLDSLGDAMAGPSTNVVLPAGLVLDLKGDSGVVLDSNGNVVEWMDQTTNANNAAQFFGWRPSTSGLSLPSTTPRPSTNTLLNGLQALTFTAGNYTTLQVPSTPSDAINTNFTIYVVAKVTDVSVGRYLVGKNIGNIPASFEFDANNIGGAVGPSLVSGNAGVNNVGVSSTAGSGGPVAATHVFAMTRTFIADYTNSWGGANFPPAETNWYFNSSNSVSLYLDGLATITNASCVHQAPGPWDGQQPIYIGTRQDHYTSEIMNGQIAEILLFNTPLSGADRTNVDNYLGLKWFNGVSFVTGVPSITTSNGFAVNISPGPSSGSTHLSGYQWQENGTNIPGAAGPSYTTGILAPSDNGDIFSLVVTLANGGSYTNTTTLTVLDQPPYVTVAGLPLWNTTNNIVVLFDEAVTPATATVTANYTLNNGVSVLSAAMVPNTSNEVVLTTSALTWNENPGYYTATVANVQDYFGNTISTVGTAVGLFPANVGLWVKAGTQVSAANGNNGNVSQWNDLSGNGNNLSVISSTYPVLTNGAFGDPVVRFTGTNNGANFNQMYAPSAGSLGIVGDITVAAVVNYATLAGGTNGEIVSKTGTGAQASIPAPYDCYVGTDEQLYRGNGGNGGNGVSYGTLTATIAPSAGQPHILIATELGNTISFFLDGQPAGSGLLSSGFQEANAVDGGQALFIGGRGDNHNRLTGDLSEMAVMGSSMNTNDILALENYLSAEYNVPVAPNSYLAITQQPVAHTNVFQYTTLTVPAGVSGFPVAIQWYSTNGTAVVGQTSAALTIPDIQTTNGYYFVATNVYGAVTSSVVVVNVIPINPNPTNIVSSVAGGKLTLSWPADHTGWQLQAQTNSVAVGISTNWANYTPSASTNQVTIPINLTNGTVFYRLMFP